MARPKGTKNRHAAKAGVRAPVARSGEMTRTKSLLNAALDLWMIKNHVPRYDYWGHYDPSNV